MILLTPELRYALRANAINAQAAEAKLTTAAAAKSDARANLSIPASPAPRHGDFASIGQACNGATSLSQKQTRVRIPDRRRSEKRRPLSVRSWRRAGVSRSARVRASFCRSL